MNFLLFVGIVLSGLVVFFILARILLTLLARSDRLFTFCAEGEIKYIMKGASLKRVIIRVTGKTLDNNYNIVDAHAGPTTAIGWFNPMYYLELFYGIYLIGLPPNTVFVYQFRWDKQESTDENDRYKIVHRDEFVDSLYYEYTYPIVVRDIDMGGNIKIDIYGNIVVRARNAYKPIMVLKGNWFQPLREAVEGALNDYPRKLTFKAFRDVEKKGPLSDIAQEVLKINGVVGNRDGHIIDVTGMEIISFNYGKFEESSTQPKEVTDALQSKEIERLKAEGVVEKAKGDADAIKRVGKAKAAALKARVAATGNVPEILQAELMATAIENTRVGTLVLNGQGGSTGTVIPIGQNTVPSVPPAQPSLPSTSPTSP